MDDAFAGGVCRCQYCGTIQTVPSLSKLKRQSAPTGAQPPPQSVGAVPPQPQVSPGSVSPVPDGLDALAEAVASSSGLGRASLRSGANQPATAAVAPSPPAARQEAAPAKATLPVDYATPPRNRQRMIPVSTAAGIGAILLLCVLGAAYFSFTRTPVVTRQPAIPTMPPRPTPDVPILPPEDDPGPPVAVPTTPHFCGISLAGEPSVVYLLDRGQATGEMFDTLKEATYRSLESLKPGQKFAVIFWNNGGEEAAYPPDGLAEASKEEIEVAQRQFVDVYAGSRADPHEAIKRAAALRPGAIVLVTGKAFDLDEDLVDLTRQSITGSQTKVHTVALGSDDGTTVLGSIANAGRGQSKVVSKRELRSYSD